MVIFLHFKQKKKVYKKNFNELKNLKGYSIDFKIFKDQLMKENGNILFNKSLIELILNNDDELLKEWDIEPNYSDDMIFGILLLFFFIVNKKDCVI